MHPGRTVGRTEGGGVHHVGQHGVDRPGPTGDQRTDQGLGGARAILEAHGCRTIADLATFMRPSLVVVDAMRVLVRNGPQGGNIDDTKEMNTVFATVDQVAADAFGCTLIGQTAENLPYLKMGQERGLGTMDWKSLRVREV